MPLDAAGCSGRARSPVQLAAEDMGPDLLLAEQRPRDLLDLGVDAGVEHAHLGLDAAAAAADTRVGDER